MKTLKITLMCALFILISGQTEKLPTATSTNTQEVNTKKQKTVDLDLLAHAVRGLRVPSQG